MKLTTIASEYAKRLKTYRGKKPLYLTAKYRHICKMDIDDDDHKPFVIFNADGSMYDYSTRRAYDLGTYKIEGPAAWCGFTRIF